jgi:cell division protein FtsI/penicillin-binding protein 2
MKKLLLLTAIFTLGAAVPGVRAAFPDDGPAPLPAAIGSGQAQDAQPAQPAVQAPPKAEAAPVAPGDRPPERAKAPFAPRALKIDDLGKLKPDASGRLYLPVGERRYLLTLDPNLQKKVSAYLKKANPVKAAFVALDPRSGDVLALAETARNLKTNPHPISDDEPPSASIFKIVTSLALYQEPGFRDQDKVCYHGGLRSLSKGNVIDNPKLDRACDGIERAFAKSINPVFAKLAYRLLEAKDLTRVAAALGFGKTALPFPLDFDARGLTLPEDDIGVAIKAAGFWSSHLSPIHGALIGAVLAGDGSLRVPRLVSEVREGEQVLYRAPEAESRQVFDAAPVKAVRKLMEKTGSIGTGRKYVAASKLLKKLGVPCKSGSLTGYGPDKLHYSWFVGYAPAENPTIAFAAMVGNDDKWKINAGRLMREALETYFATPKQASLEILELHSL